jgi:predicted GNAT family N-acyltransferase
MAERGPDIALDGRTSAMLVRWCSGATDLDGALALRELVFCGEQGVSIEEEHDGRDEDALHLVALDPAGGRVVGTLRVLRDGDVAKVGRVAVERSWRRRGIAARMLREALAQAERDGARTARLAAQIDAIALYEQAGFQIVSPEFLDAGIVHVWMSRDLGSVAEA